jgi:mono/diheme cytochrome c family protein
MRLRLFAVIVLLLGALALAVLGAMTTPATLPAGAFGARNFDLANGEAMFNIGGCASCHAKNAQDRLQLGGGKPLRSPFGTFKVPNISSDVETGIGGWSEAQFSNAMLKGVGHNNQHLYPSFPYTSYQRMQLDDVRDLFAFLKTVPAVKMASEPHQLPFPFNVRLGIGAWKLLFVDGKPLQPDPMKGAVHNRGAYLVEGPGHCAECHSTRNILGAIKPAGRFAGGAALEGSGWVPNITPHPDGLASWTTQDMELFLLTGLTPDGYPVGDTMADVIQNTSRLTTQDRHAMAVYLRALPAVAGKKPTKQR